VNNFFATDINDHLDQAANYMSKTKKQGRECGAKSPHRREIKNEGANLPRWVHPDDILKKHASIRGVKKTYYKACRNDSPMLEGSLPTRGQDRSPNTEEKIYLGEQHRNKDGRAKDGKVHSVKHRSNIL